MSLGSSRKFRITIEVRENRRRVPGRCHRSSRKVSVRPIWRHSANPGKSDEPSGYLNLGWFVLAANRGTKRQHRPVFGQPMPERQQIVSCSRHKPGAQPCRFSRSLPAVRITPRSRCRHTMPPRSCTPSSAPSAARPTCWRRAPTSSRSGSTPAGSGISISAARRHTRAGPAPRLTRPSPAAGDRAEQVFERVVADRIVELAHPRMEIATLFGVDAAEPARGD